MIPEIKQKWLTALRSGDYVQTKRFLQRDDKFCCLGVLCDIYGMENNVKWVNPNILDSDEDASEVLDVFPEYNLDVMEFMDETEILPVFVVHWAGLSEPNPQVVVHPDLYVDLASLNDSGYSFDEIADLIEDNL